MIDRNGLHGKTACGGLHHMNDEFDPPTARRASLDAQRNCNPQAFCHQGTSRDIDLIIPVEERPITVLARMHPIKTAVATSQKRARVIDDDKEYILDAGDGNRTKRGCAEEDRLGGQLCL